MQMKLYITKPPRKTRTTKNCKALLTEKLYSQTFKTRKTPGEKMMEELQKELRMPVLPDHIECFDNSNFQGSSPVASVVVFKDGKPAKRDYVTEFADSFL